MNKHVIGENAGILWRLMNNDCHRRWEFEELKKGTGLGDLELASAIGWLAQENKIEFELRRDADNASKKAYVYLMLNNYF